MTVYILTYCRNIKNLYGTLLVFKTLRVGFPTAEIRVFDNASLPTVRHIIRQHARDCGATFTQFESEIIHFEFIQRVVSESRGSVIFVDPDICFWESVEGWNFDNFLIAGRLIPRVDCLFPNRIVTQPRLHTSFLWIPSVSALYEQLMAIKTQYHDFSPFRPSMFNIEGIWQRFDTAGPLYSALPQDRLYTFTEKELNAYDHIFCGTHLKFLSAILADYARQFEELHELAKTDYTKVKGAWRWQEEFFKHHTT